MNNYERRTVSSKGGGELKEIRNRERIWRPNLVVRISRGHGVIWGRPNELGEAWEEKKGDSGNNPNVKINEKNAEEQVTTSFWPGHRESGG